MAKWNKFDPMHMAMISKDFPAVNSSSIIFESKIRITQFRCFEWLFTIKYASIKYFYKNLSERSPSSISNPGTSKM